MIMVSKTEYMKEWRKKNRERHLQYKKDYRKRHRKEIVQKHKELRNQRKELLYEILGRQCILCETKEDKMIFHEVHGIRHPQLTDVSLEWVKEHIDDFVPLCLSCHYIVTKIVLKWNLDWDDVLEIVRRRKKIESCGEG